MNEPILTSNFTVMGATANQLNRQSIRYVGYDYTQPGAYFVTLVAFRRQCIFGEIITKQIHFSRLGKFVEDLWMRIPVHFHNIDIEPFIVMPNHIHGIITIKEDSRGTIYRAPTEVRHNNISTSINQSGNLERLSKPVAGSIPTIIRTYKAAVSRLARQKLDIAPVWQRNYYEHIIRNEQELNAMSTYILANPHQWSDDPENSPFL